MVRAYTQEHIYRHPWDRVTSASWRKFTDPDTPAVLSHVLDVHTLSRRLDTVSGSLHTIRSITVRSPTLPFFLRRIVGGEAVVCHCIETSVVDPRARSMDIVSVNASLRGLLEFEERSSYRPHPENPEGWTVLRQQTRIRCKPLKALAAVAEKVEQRCADRFQQNSLKGREFVERICKYLEAESSSVPAAAMSS
ncbi:hypothetical protein KSP40_PGU001005 [Platanthera guangdongensis]|uniref:PRELI/MSF1 domain-containing protein n=1 Tax=Platanthera guangdongensis TaxID=2320717 RepID=A0ABR2M2M4_9ASPA